jgi:hypothetical protein
VAARLHGVLISSQQVRVTSNISSHITGTGTKDALVKHPHPIFGRIFKPKKLTSWSLSKSQTKSFYTMVKGKYFRWKNIWDSTTGTEIGFMVIYRGREE